VVIAPQLDEFDGQTVPLSALLFSSYCRYG
jgi:hypothetical protein